MIFFPENMPCNTLSVPSPEQACLINRCDGSSAHDSELLWLVSPELLIPEVSININLVTRPYSLEATHTEAMDA